MSGGVSDFPRRPALSPSRKARSHCVERDAATLPSLRGHVRPAVKVTRRRFGWLVLCLSAATALSACTLQPLNPFTADGPPVVMVPINYAGVTDRRGRFREIFCALLEARAHELPDYMPCQDALTKVGTEPSGTGMAVNLGMSTSHLKVLFVPGVGWNCVANWLDLSDTVGTHLRGLGYDFSIVKQESLSSSERNARSVRDAVMALRDADTDHRVVLVGYSKGIVDILEAVVSFPEIRSRLAAVVSVAGSVGGSPLANGAGRFLLGILKSWPGSECTASDSGALESLRTPKRQRWLFESEPPPELRYYSLVTLPRPDRVSTALLPTYNRLSAIDARNDGQMMYYDQVVPGSSLLGYLNADHWAVAVPISRTPKLLANLVVDKNAFPREALLEATLRIIEEDIP